VADFKHDVSLSFAGAQRDYVSDVAAALVPWGASIFYDDDFRVELWGDDLNEALQRVYGRESRFVVMFVSREYEASAFPTAERRAAFAGAMHGESIVLPVRFPCVAHRPMPRLLGGSWSRKDVARGDGWCWGCRPTTPRLDVRPGCQRGRRVSVMHAERSNACRVAGRVSLCVG
jgi:TIR domain